MPICSTCGEEKEIPKPGYLFQCKNLPYKCGMLGYVGTTAQHDAVNHPAHYTLHPSGVECIQITEHMNFNIGNAVKYLWRADLKNGLEDLRKALWYIDREIQRVERCQP